MLKKSLVYIISALIPMLLIGSCMYSIKKVSVEDLYIKRDTITVTVERIDTIVKTDTVYLEEKTKYFKTFDDILLFVVYLKTQSNRLDDDNWTVIHTLFNRMDKHKCSWREYFYTPKINHSHTIKRILRGEIEVDYSLDRKHDRDLLERVVDAYLGYNPTNTPKNVLYFESFNRSPNRGVFRKNNIWRKYRHKFYLGDITED